MGTNLNAEEGGSAMKAIRVLSLFVCLSVVAFCATPATAFDLPAVNLGFTTFMDGAPPAGPGVYFAQYVQYYSASKFMDGSGNEMGLPSPDLKGLISLTQVIYQSKRKWGLDLIVPTVKIDLSYGAAGPFPTANGAGIGDILIGPYYQWDPIMGDKGPVFMHRFELQMIFPTGKYSATYAINPGSKLISINPYWAFTYFLKPNLTTSWRIHYLWNGENSKTKIQPGQAIHANFGIAYEATPRTFRIGLNGYALKQLGESKTNGTKNPKSQEQVIALGPGGAYHFSQNDHLFFSGFYEMAVKNRTKGIRFMGRYVHHF